MIDRLLLAIFFVALASFILSYTKAAKLDLTNNLIARPSYHAYATLLLTLIPALVLSIIFYSYNVYSIKHQIEKEFINHNNQTTAWIQIKNIINGIDPTFYPTEINTAANSYLAESKKLQAYLLVFFLIVAAVSFFIASRKIKPKFDARNFCEKFLKLGLLLASLLTIFTTIGIVISLFFESYKFFKLVSPLSFLFGTHWSLQVPLGAVTADFGSFGAVPLFAGTLLISLIALSVACPIGLFTAIYLSEYATYFERKIGKPLLEILAGIPTVVYGFFAAIFVAPFIRQLGESLGLNVASESALAAGVVMGVMIIPYVSSLSDDVINAVPQSLRDGSFAIGATKSETIRLVLIPAALPGIISAFLLAASRAIGETMIVVMAAGLTANLTFNPLDKVTTVTVQIVTALVGDQEFDSPKTLSVFALGLVLFFVTLILNVISLQIVKRYKEQYD